MPLKPGHSAVDVVVELLGNQWNAIVCEVPSRIIRHALVTRSGARPIRVGKKYGPPPPTDRVGTEGELDPAWWERKILGEPPPSRRRALIARVAWTSSLNADAILAAAGASPAIASSEDAAPDDGGEPSDLAGGISDRDDGRSGHVDAGPDPGHGASTRADKPATRVDQGMIGNDPHDDPSLALWRRLARADRRSAVILQTERGAQPYPMALPGVPSERVDSLLAAFSTTIDPTGPDIRDASEASLLPPEVIDHLDRTRDLARRRVTALEAEFSALPDPDRLRAVGDLVLARFRDVPSGAESVTLDGFDGTPVTVALDPRLSTHKNAEAYYDRAARAERAAARLPGLLASARNQVATLGELAARAGRGDIGVDELQRALPRPRTAPTGPDGTEATLPYRSYRSSGGLEIRVGRGARHNDALTFRHSAPDDVWLHAHQAAGAHVILRWGRKEAPPARDLTEAAVLAAVHSKARTSGSVAVSWTFKKYVRKPRKSAPGQVVPERVRTVFVTPDFAVARRLADGGGSIPVHPSPK